MATAEKKCPICGKQVVEKFAPFCSKRCAMLDLGKWLGDGYRVESGEEDEQSLPDSDEETE